jgi:hypothetical protein
MKKFDIDSALRLERRSRSISVPMQLGGVVSFSMLDNFSFKDDQETNDDEDLDIYINSSLRYV